MEETNTQNSNTKAGRGLGIAGFVVSLVAIVLWMPMSAAAGFAALVGGGTGIAIFLLIMSLAGLIMSVMGLMKANKGGGKKGLAIAGLVIGLIVTILSVYTFIGVNKAKEEAEKMGLGSKFEETLKEGMEHGLDSLANELKEAMDSTKTHE
jgi:hypothetical protein